MQGLRVLVQHRLRFVLFSDELAERAPGDGQLLFAGAPCGVINRNVRRLGEGCRFSEFERLSQRRRPFNRCVLVFADVDRNLGLDLDDIGPCRLRSLSHNIKVSRGFSDAAVRGRKSIIGHRAPHDAR